MLTAEEILKMTKPGDLFSADLDKLKAEFKNLAKAWHPDVHSDPELASKVMTKINELHDVGLKQLKDGKWTKSNFVQFRSKSGELHNIKFFVERPFELGTLYVCNTIIVYAIEKDHKSFYENFVKRTKDLRYYDDAMEHEFKRYMPHVKSSFESDDHFVIVVDKPSDVFPLRDVLTYFKGKIPDRHAAWIIGTLYNIACFLDYNKLSHNGITVDNYFICPEKHSGVLLGGWMYAVNQGEKMIGAPRDVFEIMSHKTKDDKFGTYATDLDSIRLLGRAILGDTSGHNLDKQSTMPKPIIDWLLGASTKGPIEEYTNWMSTLDRGFGKRKFVELPLTAKDLYTQ